MHQSESPGYASFFLTMINTRRSKMRGSHSIQVPINPIFNSVYPIFPTSILSKYFCFQTLSIISHFIFPKCEKSINTIYKTKTQGSTKGQVSKPAWTRAALLIVGSGLKAERTIQMERLSTAGRLQRTGDIIRTAASSNHGPRAERSSRSGANRRMKPMRTIGRLLYRRA
ncbi:hypothetical protein Y032_0004g1968 [Ancylostoma ceylanicum]|uniref:Uncharacterized protein n=1 Tax=Ancylostoma ceylanicum TaxID=53326 RepID=A0A016VVS6_9BILA|nr:hypothetical protein Y032_0004g1968 [Ancylostoma ceylanicum]